MNGVVEGEPTLVGAIALLLPPNLIPQPLRRATIILTPPPLTLLTIRTAKTATAVIIQLFLQVTLSGFAILSIFFHGCLFLSVYSATLLEYLLDFLL